MRALAPKRILKDRRAAAKAYRAAKAINRNRVLKRDGCVCAECGYADSQCKGKARLLFAVVPLVEPYPSWDSDIAIVASDYRVLCLHCYRAREERLVGSGMYDQIPF